MDYLRGRPERKVTQPQKQVRVEVPSDSLFETFAQKAFDMFTPDQRAWLYTEFLNENIISVLKDDDNNRYIFISTADYDLTCMIVDTFKFTENKTFGTDQSIN